jgi:hypothetical protein
MQLHAGMVGACEATAPQTMRLHAEIAPILLGHDVGRNFTCAENGMFGTVDPHLFRNPIIVARQCVLPAPL